ncbi:hypothetical protein [Sphingosinithalassobacter sp. CS137]|uniref:hypothetical protein n=1 Tax=Sphingosinithalassobacter sp. CS137 TaxID=2762748 RepID=UPI00165E6062|nr:hypothetical protein [Sphingosinithalassobacter sp. CS137]
MTTLFHGSALCEVDADGTLPVPEFLAEALGAAAPGTEILVSRHEADQCLVAYPRDHLQTLRRQTERRRRAEERAGRDPRGHHRRVRRTFGAIEPMPRTASRMCIPPAMRHLGRIDALALFVGAGESFEIWNPDLAAASDDDHFRDLAAWSLDARGRDTNSTPGEQ